MAMFGQNVSHGLLNFFKTGCLNEKKLDQIQGNGLRNKGAKLPEAAFLGCNPGQHRGR